jgi:hypothetical protein
MPDTPAPKGKKKGDVLGLPWWGWGLAIAGAVGAYILYKRHVEDEASAATGTTDENTGEPVDTGASSSTTSPTVPTFSTFAEWEQAAIAAMTSGNYSSANALNDLSAWTSGGCVSAAGYTAIGGILETVGLPPGFSSVPTLSVCPDASPTTPKVPVPNPTVKGTTTTPDVAPTLSASVRAAMSNNGESIVDTAYDSATKTWLYLTNKGGVYAVNSQGSTTGATFYGSYLGLPAKDTEGAARTFEKLLVNSNGTYTLVDTQGQTYTFGPTTPQKTATKKTTAKVS